MYLGAAVLLEESAAPPPLARLCPLEAPTPPPPPYPPCRRASRLSVRPATTRPSQVRDVSAVGEQVISGGKVGTWTYWAPEQADASVASFQQTCVCVSELARDLVGTL